MRHIAKSAEPADFAAWKKQKSTTKQPSWDSIDDDAWANVKHNIKQALLNEQGFVCCYCEQRIETASSHIEHLEPRHSSPKRAFDYTNFLASCTKPEHCGSHKGNKTLQIHPLLPNCRDYFVFASDGNVRPTNDPALRAMAEETITILGLGIARLNAQRKSAITGFVQTLNGMNQNQRRAMLASIDARDAQGTNRPFASAVLSVVQPRSST
jgi:uncharacterized protein (TIGR02646 family)